MKETIKLGITLMIVTLIASLALAITNHYTAPQIETQKGLAIKESLNKVITADSFEEKEGYYDAYDKDKGLIGRVLKVEAPGYSSIIQALVGINLENEIMGIDIVSHQETPGLGASIEKESFLKQFISKGKEELKIKKDDGEIDAVTGATISSRAVTDAVRKMMEQCPCDAITAASPKNHTEENESIEEIAELDQALEEVDNDLKESMEIEEYPIINIS